MNKFKSEVTVTIDEHYDLGYIYFKSPWGSSEKQRHVKGDCNIILDFDAEGHIIGIETLRAREHIHPIMRAPGKTSSEVVAALRAALPAEPSEEFVENAIETVSEVVSNLPPGHQRWDRREYDIAEMSIRAAYRVLRAHLLGEMTHEP